MKKPRRSESTPLFSTADRNATRRNVVAINRNAVNAIKKRGGSSLLLSYGPPSIQTGAVSWDAIAKPARAVAPNKSLNTVQQQEYQKADHIAHESSGQTAPCDDQKRAIDDPAVAIAMVVHYARMAMAQRSPLPSSVLELFAQRLSEGDPACKVVANWLERCRLIRATALPLTSRKSDNQ